MALPALMEDLVQEILLRVAPDDDPSHLIRAAAVCKAWRRILSDGGFRRRYCTFHRTRPLLGYIYNFCEGLELVTTTKKRFFPPPLLASTSSRNSCYTAIECRHGRVLIDDTSGFIVWDPITGGRQHLSFPADAQNLSFYTGALLCAVEGCDHLHCHDGPFLVVFVGETKGEGAHHHGSYTWASVYSSEIGQWSAQTSGKQHWPVTNREPSLLMGGALYFTNFEILGVQRILKYDLTSHGLSVIDDVPELYHKCAAVEIDGGLGLVEAYDNTICIYTWSLQQDGVGRWVQVRHHNVVEPNTLIPYHRRSHYQNNPRDVVRFVEGTDTVLFTLNNYIDTAVFTFDLKTRTARKVAETWDDDILPYTCFYTPGITCRSCQG